MRETTMEVLETQKIELQKSKLITTQQRSEGLRLNAFARSLLDILDATTLEEVEELLAKARQVDALESKIMRVESEIEATRAQQETANGSK